MPIRRFAPLLCLAAVLTLAYLAQAPRQAAADSVLEEWRAGLSGALLASYSGSVISSNSTLTLLRLCRSGRYQIEQEGSWSAEGRAAGAHQTRLSGRYSVQSQDGVIMLDYVTDAGEHGSYPVYLQANGKVNIGGAAYAAERGGAGC